MKQQGYLFRNCLQRYEHETSKIWVGVREIIHASENNNQTIQNLDFN